MSDVPASATAHFPTTATDGSHSAGNHLQLTPFSRSLTHVQSLSHLRHPSRQLFLYLLKSHSICFGPTLLPFCCPASDPQINPVSMTIRVSSMCAFCISIAPTSPGQTAVLVWRAGWVKSLLGGPPASAFPCPPTACLVRPCLRPDRGGAPSLRAGPASLHQPGRCSLVLPPPARLTAPLPEIIPF